MIEHQKQQRLIVIEGLDGSGKGTQAQLLAARLQEQNLPLRKISFPDYNSPSSSLVKMYLSGDFGETAGAVNPYAASSFYAVDRFASFQTDWKKDYLAGKLILCDRYVTSNMIFQLGKLPLKDWDDYLAWLEDFEYNKLRLPRPDLVIFLDMPIAISQKLISERYQGDENRKDIHERDLLFLEESHRSACYAAQKLGWKKINCAESSSPKPIEVIHQEVKSEVLKLLEIGE